MASVLGYSYISMCMAACKVGAPLDSFYATAASFLQLHRPCHKKRKMSEYWKSTPKYWCKYCSIYVRDTKLERSNHEATGKHQGALKRSLRDIHRNHEREERDKERARREIDRLNGVVGSSSAGPSGSRAPTKEATDSQLKSQREQLAAMGVSMPSDFRPEMAMPGEWTVTKTTVIEEKQELDGQIKTEAKATGVRKREETEDQKEEEEAMRSLFKKPRRWGRDSKTMPDDEDEDLEALLSTTVPLKAETVEQGNAVKKEEDVDSDGAADTKLPKEEADHDAEARDVKPLIKKEPLVKAEEEEESSGITPVVFKKRKPKGIRTK